MLKSVYPGLSFKSLKLKTNCFQYFNLKIELNLKLIIIQIRNSWRTVMSHCLLQANCFLIHIFLPSVIFYFTSLIVILFSMLITQVAWLPVQNINSNLLYKFNTVFRIRNRVAVIVRIRTSFYLTIVQRVQYNTDLLIPISVEYHWLLLWTY